VGKKKRNKRKIAQKFSFYSYFFLSFLNSHSKWPVDQGYVYPIECFCTIVYPKAKARIGVKSEERAGCVQNKRICCKKEKSASVEACTGRTVIVVMMRLLA
jgi:hypothetical protein